MEDLDLDHYAFQVMILAAMVTTTSAAEDFERRPSCGRDRQPINPGGPTEAMFFAEELLDSHPRRFFELFRVTTEEFRALVEKLDELGATGSRYQSLEQKVMVFLWIVAFNESQRNAAHFFKVTQSSVSKTVHRLLPSFLCLHREYVRLPDDSYVSPEIELNPKVSSMSGCIGAIDGTLIHARLPEEDKERWRCRKGFIAQNVFAAVKFDGSFTFVLAGAEGSMHDSQLERMARHNGWSIPEGRYYIADQGFTSCRGIVIPFRATRYHLSDWRDAPNKPRTRKELYNLRHSRMRVIVEQAFGWLKRRFKIVRETAPEYDLQSQIHFVYALTGLYNFIHHFRKQQEAAFVPDDIIEAELLEESRMEEEMMLEEARERADEWVLGKDSEELRRAAAVRMWDSYQEHVHPDDE